MNAPFIELIPINQQPWYIRIILKSQKKRFGQELIPTQQWARKPVLFFLFSFFFKYFERKSSSIDPMIRSLVMVHISQINWCKFCVDLNSHFFFEKNGAKEKLHNLKDWRESSIFNEKERATLDYAEAITLSDREATQKEQHELKKFYNDHEIIELTALIAYQNMSSKFNSALNVPAQGLCELPKRS